MTQTAQPHDANLSSVYLQNFFSEKTITERLPAVCRDGEVLKMPSVRCPHCHGSISNKMVRGTLRRTKPWLVSVQASTFCARCQVISPLQLRLHNRGAVETYTNGVWVKREPSKLPQYRLDLADKSRSFVEKVRNACDVKRFVIGFSGKGRK